MQGSSGNPERLHAGNAPTIARAVKIHSGRIATSNISKRVHVSLRASVCRMCSLAVP